MKGRWMFACSAIVIAAGFLCLKASAMSSASSPPPAKIIIEGGCVGGGGDELMARKGTVDIDGSCTGYPEESCGGPMIN